MGDVSLIDIMLKDGLMDVYNGYHMGITAENLAEQYQIGREEQDAFSLRSQTLAAAARDAGRFDKEIAPRRGARRGALRQGNRPGDHQGPQRRHSR
jgi:acetyl-CoA C-acetyltransferase